MIENYFKHLLSNTLRNYRSYRVRKNSGQVLLFFMGVFTLLLLSACRDELEIYKIDREGVFSYSTNDITKEYANNVHFFQGKTVVHQFDDGMSKVYTRYLLEAKGINAAGKKVIFNIEFDIVNTGNYIGIYYPECEVTKGGIYAFNYLVETAAGQYESYNLDPGYYANDYFRVERQNMEERLILGDFRAHLQSDKNPDVKIVFYEGTFKDISYALY